MAPLWFKFGRQSTNNEPADPSPAVGRPVWDEVLLESRLHNTSSTKLVRATIQDEAQRHLKKLEDCFYQQRRAYSERMHIQDVRPDIEREAAKTLGELETLTNKTERDLEIFRTEYANKLSDYDHFKEHNRLNREPYYPKSKLRHSLLAICAGGIETFFNGNMLAIGALGGLIQGYTIALTISVINVGGAFWAGNWARLLNDRTAIRQGLGVFVVLLGAVILILFNLLVAHYREALVASGEYTETIEAGKRAWDAFSKNWFGVSDFMSWLLFGMGAMSAGLGAWKGYSMEDPYPGYSRRARALKDAQIGFQHKQEDAMDGISKLQAGGVKKIDHYVDQFRIRRTKAGKMRTNILDLDRDFQRERERLLSRIKLLQAKHCPDEEPIFLGELHSEQEPAPVKSIDFALVEECARRRRQKLADHCNTAMISFKTTV